MENQFVINQLETVATSIALIEQQQNCIKDSLRVLFGYLKADMDLSIPQYKGGAYTQNKYESTETIEILEFTQKEISKMPKFFRTLIKIEGVRAHIRQRIRNNSINYEIRFRARGYNISASGVTREDAKARFIQKLNDRKNGIKPVAPDVPKTFDKFALYYFENFRKRKVKPITYKNDVWRLNKYILPQFGSMLVKDINTPMCQKLIDDIAATGKSKTVEEIFSLLNCTFKIAIRHNLITHNPLDIVIYDKHERIHGKALSTDEEKILLSTAAEPYKTIFAVLLYTGLRPNEYPSARIVGNLIHANNSKRHNGKKETKRIPITPMLKPFLADTDTLPERSVECIRDEFNKIFNGTHRLYDLRTTFYTRCQMCNIAPTARDEFVGHSSGELANTYTDLPDDYLIKEGQKLDY